MKRKVLWIVMVIVMMFAFGACSKKEQPDQTSTPTFETAQEEDVSNNLFRENVYILKDGTKVIISNNAAFSVMYNENGGATGTLDKIDKILNEEQLKELRELIGDYKGRILYVDNDISYIDNRDNESINPIDEDKPFKDANRLAVGVISAFAVTDDLKVIGSDDKYNISNWEDILSIDYMYDILIGLKSDGTVITKGRKVDTEDWTDIIQVCAGLKYIVGLKEDGTVLAAGHNGDGQCNVGTWTDIRLIATGWRHTVGLTNDGQILLAGRVSDKSREMAKEYQGTNIKDIVAGGGGDIGQGHTVILYNDGTCKAFGDNTYNQCDVDNWTDIVQISAGDWHTLGLKSDGTVVVTNPTNPGSLYTGCLRVTDWTDIISIEAGTGLSVGVKSDGSIICVGYNSEGQREAINNMHN